jgi:hypothetical protein
MYLQKVISRKTFLQKFFFFGILKVNDENSRTRIRTHTKMSWICNTARNIHTDGSMVGGISRV